MSQRAYYEFMGYPTEELTRRYAPYSERFAAGSTVLDVGCGRGEFLQLLSARGVDAVGIDMDEEMVDEVRGKGLNAEVADAISYLEARPSGLDGVFAAHLIEHLSPEPMRSLVRAAAVALRPGGRLLLVTPNPHSLEVQLYEFWTDLQHVRFYTPEIMRWVLHDAGFRDIEAGDNPEYRSGRDLAMAPTNSERLLAPAESRLRSRLRRRVTGWFQSPTTLERIGELEQRHREIEASIASMVEHYATLFPPGEFYVTGVR